MHSPDPMDPKTFAKELRAQIEDAILRGPMCDITIRLNRALDEFEAKIEAYVERQSLHGAQAILERMNRYPYGQSQEESQTKEEA